MVRVTLRPTEAVIISRMQDLLNRRGRARHESIEALLEIEDHVLQRRAIPPDLAAAYIANEREAERLDAELLSLLPPRGGTGAR